MGLISISIDMSGSVDLKRKIKEFSKTNNNILIEYQNYLKHFFHLEMDFYSQIVNYKLDLSKVFVPKLLGDEVWITYNLNGTEPNTLNFNEIFYGIYSAALTLNQRIYNFSVSERELTEEEEYDFRLQENIKFKNMALIPRIFIDYIDEFQDISKIRYEVFHKRFWNLFPNEQKKTHEEKEKDLSKYADYLNNLNVAVAEDKGNKKVKMAQRWDAVGFEIDLFFRCASKSLAGLTGIGKHLFESLYQEESINNEVNSKNLKFILPMSIDKNNSNRRYEHYNMLAEYKIDKKELKGIKMDYSIYFLLDQPTINDLKYKYIQYPYSSYRKTIDKLKSINVIDFGSWFKLKSSIIFKYIRTKFLSVWKNH